MREIKSQLKNKFSQNSTIGSPVFQVVSSDPDDPNTANGRLTYRLLDNGKFGRDTLAFSIGIDRDELRAVEAEINFSVCLLCLAEPESGLITTRQPLDREKQREFTLIIVVQDDGSPPQKASSVLRVEVTDVDDHKPIFRRTLVSKHAKGLEFFIQRYSQLNPVSSDDFQSN